MSLADSGAASNSSSALDNLNKLQKLLVLLDKEMHEYLFELRHSEELSNSSWQKVGNMNGVFDVGFGLDLN